MVEIVRAALAAAFATVLALTAVDYTTQALGFRHPKSTVIYTSSATDNLVKTTAQDVKIIQTDLAALSLVQTKVADRFSDVESQISSSLPSLTTMINQLHANFRTLTGRHHEVTSAVEGLRRDLAARPTVIVEKIIEREAARSWRDAIKEVVIYLTMLVSVIFGITGRMGQRKSVSREEFMDILKEHSEMLKSSIPLPRQQTPPPPAASDPIYEARVNEPRSSFTTPIPPNPTPRTAPINTPVEPASRRFNTQRKPASPARRPFTSTSARVNPFASGPASSFPASTSSPPAPSAPSPATPAEEPASEQPTLNKRQIVRRLQDRYDEVKKIEIPDTFDLEHDGSLARTNNNEPIFVKTAALQDLFADLAELGPANNIDILGNLRISVTEALEALDTTDLAAFATVRIELEKAKANVGDLSTCTSFTTLRGTQEALRSILNRVAVYAHNKSSLVRTARKHIVTSIVSCSTEIDAQINSLYDDGRAEDPRFGQLEMLRNEVDAVYASFESPELDLSNFTKSGKLAPVGAGKVVLGFIETMNGLLGRVDSIQSADNVFDVDIRAERKVLVDVIQSLQDTCTARIEERYEELQASPMQQ